VIVIVLFVSGLTRSLQFSAFNSLAFADVPPEQTSAANTLVNVVQQLTLGLGITAAAAAVHLPTLLHRGAGGGQALTDFRAAIVAAAIMTAISTLDAVTLAQDAGSLVSGHRPLGSEHQKDLVNSNPELASPNSSGQVPEANGGDPLREGGCDCAWGMIASERTAGLSGGPAW
jgi:hypothetical protein